ncbi:hypothetical protein [Archangium sp.]|uniref:hypothetical protein n=1 Tax=Archangium sp. TaxID=1872627 RepID=UPI002D51EAE2|nr:hypothetical protein [Archangium sp.]HYO51228.1 hypothetical protein [Archangium sp.]
MSTSTGDGMEGSGGWKQRWPRRRVLRWALGLAPIAAGGGWAAFEWLGGHGWRAEQGNEDPWASKQLQGAALLCFAGDPNAAFALSVLLQSPRPDGQALLLRACLSMEEGDWGRVGWYLSYPNIRDTPEARLLLELAERRPRAPDWRHAFFDAWTALGRPDFRKSTLLPKPLELNLVLADIKAVWEAASEAQRLPLAVLDLSVVEPHREWVLEQVRASQSVPLLMALREQLYGLEPQVPVHQFLLPVVEARLGELSGPSPRTLQLALVPFLADLPLTVPFERRDLEVLETLVKLPEWKQPSSEQFFLELRALFDGLLIAPAHHAWLVASSAQATSQGGWVVQRARASKAHLSEDDQRWMGRLLWEVGARLREQRSRMELERGLLTQIFGSELTGHSPTRMDSIGMWVELGRWEEALKQAAYYRWPLASLQEESCEPRARDEHVWLQAFAGKLTLP